VGNGVEVRKALMTFLEAFKQQRIALASATIVAILLIFVIRAPALPVAAGCFLSLAYFILKSWSRSTSRKKDR